MKDLKDAYTHGTHMLLKHYSDELTGWQMKDFAERETTKPDDLQHIYDYNKSRMFFHYEIVKAVAENPNTSGHTIEHILKDYPDSASLKRMVAGHPNAPVHILDHLSKSEYGSVRDAVAFNIKTPPHILERLSHDEYTQTTQSVAVNPSTPTHVLERLTNHDHFVTSHSAEMNLKSRLNKGKQEKQ